MSVINPDRILQDYREVFARTASAGRAALYESKTEELRSAFAQRAALMEGNRAPDFALPDAQGHEVALSTVLQRGPAVVTFYRGGWCSPQLPDASLSTAERSALKFDVLSDLCNVVAHAFGLVFPLPQELRDVFRSNNKALPGINGDDSWELPVPATYVITQEQRISRTFMEVDYRQRLSPQRLLDALQLPAIA